MIGADPSYRISYDTVSRSTFVDHHAPRPARERRNANEASGFPSGNGSRLPLLTDAVTRNRLPPEIAAERLQVCKQSLAQRAESRAKRVNVVSQVDCSVIGSHFSGVSETKDSLNRGLTDSKNVGPQRSKSDFDPVRHPVLQCPLPYQPAVFERPSEGKSLKRVSLNAIRRREAVEQYTGSLNASGPRSAVATQL